MSSVAQDPASPDIPYRHVLGLKILHVLDIEQWGLFLLILHADRIEPVIDKILFFFFLMNLSSILQRYWMFRRFFQELTSGLRAVGARALQFSSPASYMAVENKKIPLLLFLAGEESNGAATVACSFLLGKKEE